MRRSAAALVALTLHASLAVPCFAQSATGDAVAQKFFEEGRRLMATQSYAAACEKFDASDKLSPAGGTILNLADCYEKAGKTASAWVKYNEAADRASAAHRADAEKFARDHAHALDSRLSYLTVQVGDDVKSTPGLTIRIDGTPLNASVWGTALPVDPGTHDVQATAPGKKTWAAREKIVDSGTNSALSIDPLQDDENAQRAIPKMSETRVDTMPPEEASSKGSTQRLVGLGVGALGVVGIGVGAFFGVSALSEHNSINCPGRVCDSQADKDTNDKSQTSALVSTIAFVGGGVLLAGGVVLVLTAPHAHAERATGLRIVPSVGSSSGRILLEGRF